MKKFINKINEKISIYYLVLFLLYFLSMCLPFCYSNSHLILPNNSEILHNISICMFWRISHISTIYALAPIGIICLLIAEILICFIFYHKKRNLLNIAILSSLLINFILSSIFMLSDAYPFIAFYLMLILLIFHAVFTVLCFVYKSTNSNNEIIKPIEKQEKPINDWTDDIDW